MVVQEGDLASSELFSTSSRSSKNSPPQACRLGTALQFTLILRTSVLRTSWSSCAVQSGGGWCLRCASHVTMKATQKSTRQRNRNEPHPQRVQNSHI
eukprot:3633121-Amphidinium_carterae.1